jgi:prepilin-type N-terminal cleavage/methylation domain-containing protein
MRLAAARGFTLLEMLVVITIMGLAAALIVPSLSLPARAPIPPLIEFLQQQHTQAQQSGKAVRVFWRGNTLFTEPGEATFELPPNAYLNLSRPAKTGYLDKQLITIFYPNGSAIAADFKLMQKPPGLLERWAYQVVINPFHGGIEFKTP